MIKVNSIKGIRYVGADKLAVVDLIADTSIEVEDIGTDASSIIGMCEDAKLDFGSTCFTATMEFGILDSVGNWHFE